MKLIFRRFLFAMLAAEALSSASSWSETNKTSPSERITFFLVDSSGSMKSRWMDAEAELAAQFERLMAADSDGLFSRTEFRAASREDCADEINIAEPRPAGDWPDLPDERVFFPNDFTPLGSALKAAIVRAGQGPADIFVASDWAQSPNCGATISEALSALDPQADITITPILIRPNDADLEVARSTERFSSMLIKSGSVPAEEANGAERENGVLNSMLSFLEDWVWFFGFLILSGLAVSFGSKNTKLAIETEARTKEVKSLQRAVLYDENKNAEQELRKILGKIERSRKKALQLAEHIRRPKISKRGAIAKLKNFFWRWRMKLCGRLWPWQMVAGFLVCILLFVLAALPEKVVLFGFRFDDARAAASGVLNSDFATAFAIIWISTIFFAARQFQRRKEFEAEFALATDEADWLALARDRQLKQKAVDQYNERRKALERIEFQYPSFIPKEYESDPIKIEIRSAFEGVYAKAVELALNKSLDEGRDSADKFWAEAKRLDSYASLQSRSGADLKKFIEKLLNDPTVTQLPASWRALKDCWTYWPDALEVTSAIFAIQNDGADSQSGE